MDEFCELKKAQIEDLTRKALRGICYYGIILRYLRNVKYVMKNRN